MGLERLESTKAAMCFVSSRPSLWVPICIRPFVYRLLIGLFPKRSPIDVERFLQWVPLPYFTSKRVTLSPFAFMTFGLGLLTTFDVLTSTTLDVGDLTTSNGLT